MESILIPAATWKVGRPNVKIRKAAVICMMKLLEKKLIDPQKLYESFRGDRTSYLDDKSKPTRKAVPLMPIIKGCLDDDWANDIRFTAVTFLRHLLEVLHPLFDEEDYKELYPEMLKRLDDS